MNTQSDTNNIEGGNTVTPSYNPKSLRRCCFTLNNYSDIELQALKDKINEKVALLIVGKEVGESGTPHLQGYVEFKKPKQWSTVKRFIGERCHIEKARGTRAQNIQYCQKECHFWSNFPTPEKEQVLAEYGGVQWYVWQQEIIDLIQEDPDKRKVYWYVDTLGAKGKSFLARYIYLKFNALLVGGKKADIFYQVQKRLENEDDQKPFNAVILDIPRHQQDFVNYGVLEDLKNGLVVSSKYEGGTFVFRTPHVIVFSNSEPDYNKFSLDRWVLKTL